MFTAGLRLSRTWDVREVSVDAAFLHVKATVLTHILFRTGMKHNIVVQ